MLRPLMSRRASAGKGAEHSAARDDRTAFGTWNFVTLGAAAAAIAAGYLLLARGSITAAPLLLVLGYVVLIPAGLLIGIRSRGE